MRARRNVGPAVWPPAGAEAYVFRDAFTRFCGQKAVDFGDVLQVLAPLRFEAILFAQAETAQADEAHVG